MTAAQANKVSAVDEGARALLQTSSFRLFYSLDENGLGSSFPNNKTGRSDQKAISSCLGAVGATGD
jgi:hypothetical protein